MTMSATAVNYHSSVSILSPLLETPRDGVSRETTCDVILNTNDVTRKRTSSKVVRLVEPTKEDYLDDNRVGSDYYSSENDDDEDDVSGYETDLDLEKDKELRRKPKERDDIAAYKKACVDVDTVEQAAILGMMNHPNMGLAYRNIGPLGAKALSLGLMHNIHVEYLDIKYNGLSAEGATYICEMLLENDTIQILDLTGNDLQNRGAMAVSEMMRLNKGLNHLIVASNGFVDSDSEILAAGIQANNTIRQLNLSDNGLSTRGGRAVGLAMAVNYTIRKLDLSWNHIREKGAVALCKGLQENVAVTHLNLSHNGFGYPGSLALEKLLKTNSVIQYLDISHNRITWDAALLVCKGIKGNDTLQTLKIGNNPLTTTGCMDLIDAVCSANCVISELDLENVCVLGEFEMMATAVGTSRTFSYRHGGVVGTHDVLGERHGKRLTPMQRVIAYMKKRGLRPTELFRSMDKQVANRITHQEMIVRLKNAGIDMQMYEVIELLDHLERNASNLGEPGGVNYKNVSRSVQDQVIKDRMEKIRKRERLKRISSYHKEILQKGRLPPISDTDSDARTFTMGSEHYQASVRSMSRLSLDSTQRPDTATSGGDAPDFFQMRREYLTKAALASNQSDAAESSMLRGNLTRDKFRRPASMSAVTIPADLLPIGLASTSGATASSGQLSTQSMPVQRVGKKAAFSMTRPLGSKPAAFGAGKKKKKKRKIRKGRR